MTRTVVLTGPTSGIGREAAHQLARPDIELVLVGRRPEALAEVADECASAASVRFVVADFSAQASVRKAAAELLETTPRIDVLCLNAGTVSDRRRLSVDGIELTFATNHLGPFLLCELLKDRLIASAPSRVVITSSIGHLGATLDFDDLGYEHGYSIMNAYRRSKLANVLYARHLAEELRPGVEAVSYHPGAVSTGIWTGAPWWARPVLALMRLRMDDPATGGARLVRLVDEPVVSGAYYSDGRVTDPDPKARDDALGDRLVAVSRELTGLSS